MKYLVVDTAGVSANVIVGSETEAEISSLQNDRKHSDVLLGEIDALLQKQGIKISDLDVMGVVTGPGSFTGIRIGIATIKGFVAVNDCKLIGLSVFDVLRERIKNGVALLRCTRTSCYYGVYKNNEVTKVGVIENEQIDEVFGKGKTYKIENDEVDFEKAIEINGYEKLLQSAFEKAIKNKNFVKNNKLEAVYVQKSQAERELDK